MFNFQGSELIIILLLALVVLGPEKLPEAMRRLGRFYADLKKMSTGFQEEFRAAVDEPARELRETANTLRDSMDFRKLADGERDEKPKSAEMAPAALPDDPASGLAPADPDAVPTDDVPFQRAATPADDVAPGDPASGLAPADPDAVPTDDVPFQRAATPADDVAPLDGRRNEAFVRQTSTPPPPPAPFSGSADLSPGRPDDQPADQPADQEGSAPVRRIAPQVAVDDEHGLREARPADQDGAA